MGKIKLLKEFGFNTENRTYIIAEAGINHGGDLDMAMQLIESAARSGADSIKFQTYITEKRVPKEKKELFDILKKCELSFENFAQLKNHAEKNNIEFFSTPFDEESIDFLESIKVKLYKIASFDVINHSFLRSIAKTGKPIIISTGMADSNEISGAYNILKQGTDKISILHCISSYPLDPRNSDLATIYTLQNLYDCIIGYSDHTNDTETSIYAVAAGAHDYCKLNVQGLQSIV